MARSLAAVFSISAVSKLSRCRLRNARATARQMSPAPIAVAGPPASSATRSSSLGSSPRQPLVPSRNSVHSTLLARSQEDCIALLVKTRELARLRNLHRACCILGRPGLPTTCVQHSPELRHRVKQPVGSTWVRYATHDRGATTSQRTGTPREPLSRGIEGARGSRCPVCWDAARREFE